MCSMLFSQHFPNNSPKSPNNKKSNILQNKSFVFKPSFVQHVSASCRPIWTGIEPNFRKSTPIPFWTDQNAQFRPENKQKAKKNKFRKSEEKTNKSTTIY